MEQEQPQQQGYGTNSRLARVTHAGGALARSVGRSVGRTRKEGKEKKIRSLAQSIWPARCSISVSLHFYSLIVHVLLPLSLSSQLSGPAIFLADAFRAYKTVAAISYWISRGRHDTCPRERIIMLCVLRMHRTRHIPLIDPLCDVHAYCTRTWCDRPWRRERYGS